MSLVFLADGYNREKHQKPPLPRTINNHELQCGQFSLMPEAKLANSTHQTSVQMHLSVLSSITADCEGNIYAPMPVVVDFK